MWPSLPVANHIADVANFFFIGSLVVGVVATVTIVWMTGVKEAHWDEDRRGSAERIAALITQGDQLRKDTADANARAADANARALEAQAALARFKEPRGISAFDRPNLVSALSKFPGTNAAIYVLGPGPEPNGLADSLLNVLKEASWDVLAWNWSGVGSSTGVIVIPKPNSPAEIEAVCDALVAALNSVHIVSAKQAWPGPDWEHFGGMLNGPNPPSPTAAPIRIIVGTKPQ
jgi:hypothetical protein